MESVLRGFFLYFFLFMIFRIMGERTLSQITSFDFVLLLIIGEATQQALLGQDYSMTNALLVIITLLMLEVLVLKIKRFVPRVDKAIEGVPVILMENGVIIEERMKQMSVEKDDILEAARKSQGLERLDQIKFAILERDGGLSIIPAG